MCWTYYAGSGQRFGGDQRLHHIGAAQPTGSAAHRKEHYPRFTAFTAKPASGILCFSQNRQGERPAGTAQRELFSVLPC